MTYNLKKCLFGIRIITSPLPISPPPKPCLFVLHTKQNSILSSIWSTASITASSIMNNINHADCAVSDRIGSLTKGTSSAVSSAASSLNYGINHADCTIGDGFSSLIIGTGSTINSVTDCAYIGDSFLGYNFIPLLLICKLLLPCLSWPAVCLTLYDTVTNVDFAAPFNIQVDLPLGAYLERNHILDGDGFIHEWIFNTPLVHVWYVYVQPYGNYPEQLSINFYSLLTDGWVKHNITMLYHHGVNWVGGWVCTFNTVDVLGPNNIR